MKPRLRRHLPALVAYGAAVGAGLFMAIASRLLSWDNSTEVVVGAALAVLLGLLGTPLLVLPRAFRRRNQQIVPASNSPQGDPSAGVREHRRSGGGFRLGASNPAAATYYVATLGISNPAAEQVILRTIDQVPQRVVRSAKVATGATDNAFAPDFDDLLTELDRSFAKVRIPADSLNFGETVRGMIVPRVNHS